MDAASAYFVSTCSHVRESAEADASGERRLAWLRPRLEQGLRVKVAYVGGEPVGQLYVMPIELCPWGPAGRGLMALPCLFVLRTAQGRGVGRALVAAAEEEVRRQGFSGLVTQAYYHDCWFMPASFFEHLGFAVAARRGPEALLWKPFAPAAEPPAFASPFFAYEPGPHHVAVDLFYNTFCQTSEIEAQRVREVCAEFADDVLLREHRVDGQEALLRHGRGRGIFVNGREIGWGYEAPKEGVREAIHEALQRPRSRLRKVPRASAGDDK